MKSFVIKAAILGMALASGQAMAHVGYGSALYLGAGVYDPLTGNTKGAAAVTGAASNFTATAASNAGYLTGLDPTTLGNTHDIRFRYFVLDQTSTVSFTINGIANTNGSSTLNPGFSLYNGVLPASSHEGVGDVAAVALDSDTAAYLAGANDFASWSPFGGAVVSAARLGAGPADQWGVFDTNGSITTGNNGTTVATDTHGANYLGGLDTPKIATITYTGISGADALASSVFTDSTAASQSVLGADGLVDNKVSWSGILNAGIYTLAIGGANLDNYAALFADVRSSNGGTGTDTVANAAYNADRLARGLTITGFGVSAVPVPSAVWLFLSGMMGVLGFNRRKNGAMGGHITA